MSGAQFGWLASLVRCAAREPADGDADGQLLARVLEVGDEEAFGRLLQRHGSMVLRVCRRVLGHTQDAEDAFQATFLLLARNASSIRRPSALASWLHGVAYRVAARARARRARQKALEANAARAERETPAINLAWLEMQALLDEELHRLPEKYRLPLLLCYLQGLSHEEAARCLGCPVGTVRSRLARGRDRLRDRLARRGLTLSLTSFVALLAVNAPAAALPALLRDTTLSNALRFGRGLAPAGAVPQNVLILAREVSRAMVLRKLGVLAVMVLAAGLASVAVLYASRNPVPPAQPPAPESRPAPAPEEKPGEQPRLVSLRHTLKGHGGMVWAAALSPDGKSLATVSGLWNQPGELILWDPNTGKERVKVTEEKLRALAFSPDGKTLATSDYYANLVRLRDPDTGKVRRELETGRANNAVAFSPDGKLLAVAILDKTAQLWDVATGRKLFDLQGHTDWVPHVAFSPDGKLLASGSRDKTIRLWDVVTGQERLTLHGHEGTIEFLAFSPDGRTLASAGWDRTVRLWEVSSGQERAVLKGHKFQTLSVAFSPDGRTLASTSGEADSPIVATSDKPGEVKLWDVPTRKERASLSGHQFRVWMALFARNGKVLVTSAEDRTIKVWDVKPRPAVPPHDLDTKALEGLWEDLASPQGARAYDAVWRLAGSPQGAALLGRRLKPAPQDPRLAERLGKLLADLDSQTFAVRQQASRELEKLGRAAEVALREALRQKPSVEVRRRVERLLEDLNGPVADAEVLRELRAVEVLELVGTAQARRHLEELARGAAHARLTQEAREALLRQEKAR